MWLSNTKYCRNIKIFHSHPIGRDFFAWLAGDPTQDRPDD